MIAYKYTYKLNASVEKDMLHYSHLYGYNVTSGNKMIGGQIIPDPRSLIGVVHTIKCKGRKESGMGYQCRYT